MKGLLHLAVLDIQKRQKLALVLLMPHPAIHALSALPMEMLCRVCINHPHTYAWQWMLYQHVERVWA